MLVFICLSIPVFTLRSDPLKLWCWSVRDKIEAASDLDTLLSSRFLITGFELRSTREENLLALDLEVQQQQQ